MPIKWRICMLAWTLTPLFEGISFPVQLLRAANKHSFALACAASFLAATPIVTLGWETIKGLAGPNPLEELLRAPGRWALILLVIVLSATPLRHALSFAARYAGIPYGRRLADWNWMIRLRRPLGLASFFYASAHVALYVWLDVGFIWEEFISDLTSKPFITAGLVAFLLLLPLAVTSTDKWMRRLKHGWKRLHFLIYPAAVFAVLHFFWLSKSGVDDPYGYAVMVGVLLGYRIIVRLSRPKEAALLNEDIIDERSRGVLPK
jgi:sulfoxide reductase heme-binding subunit YedZ